MRPSDSTVSIQTPQVSPSCPKDSTLPSTGSMPTRRVPFRVKIPSSLSVARITDRQQRLSRVWPTHLSSPRCKVLITRVTGAFSSTSPYLEVVVSVSSPTVSALSKASSEISPTSYSPLVPQDTIWTAICRDANTTSAFSLEPPTRSFPTSPSTAVCAYSTVQLLIKPRSATSW